MRTLFFLSFIFLLALFSCDRNKDLKSEPLSDFGYNTVATWPATRILKNRSVKLSSYELKQFRNSIAKTGSYGYFFTSDYINADSFYKSIHFIHLNGDDQPDAIFNGYSGREGNIVKIYLNQEGKFEQVFDQWTDIKDLTFENERLRSITIVKLPCCSDRTQVETKYLVDDKFSFTPLYQRAKTDFTDFPRKIRKTPIRFSVLNQGYALRCEPKIDKKYAMVYADKEGGNVLTQYPKGVKGYAWAEKRDKSGRKWWFVEMDPAKLIYDSILYDEDEIPTHFLGWMSSRYLKVEKE